MRRPYWLLIFATACVSRPPPAPEPNPMPEVERQGLLASICANQRYDTPDIPGRNFRKLADGFHFVEGPVWIADAAALLFSDMQPGAGPDGVQPSIVRRWSARAGTDVFLENGGSNGLAVGVDRRLYACAHDERVVAALDLQTKQRSVVAASVSGKHFNSPNDLAVASDGSVFFTDPDWQKGNRPSETGITGVYRASPNGAVTLIDGTLDKPNGIALSPNETTLYVGSGDGKLWRYGVNTDGSTGPRELFAELPVPDGMTVDCGGNLYATSHTQGNVMVYAPDGSEIGSISIAPQLTNVAFGGADHKTLFATAGTALYAVDLNVAGAPY